MIPRKAGRFRSPTAGIHDAHGAGLTVVGGTFRRENDFLPVDYRSGDRPRRRSATWPGDRTFLDAGMDGFFPDNPDIGAEVALPEEAFAS